MSLTPHRTPLTHTHSGIYLKDETQQVTGAFKYRGTHARILASPLRGPLVAASTGNHAIATATAAREVDRPAHIFVPATTPRVKVDRILDAGGKVQPVIGDYHVCTIAASRFAADNDAELIHSFDDLRTIHGHMSLFREIDEDIHEALGRVYVPVGGGGLLAGGIAYFAETSTEVIGVEFAGAAAMASSLRVGTRAQVDVPHDVPAEGLLVREVGRQPFQFAKSAATRIIEVSELELRSAVAELWFSAGIRAELAGAAALAGYRADAQRPASSASAIVVSGGNIDAALHAEILRAHTKNGVT